MIRCSSCGINRGDAEFSLRRRQCNSCRTAQNRERLLGISADEYAAMLDAQDGLCAICQRAETALANSGRAIKQMAVDHNPDTGTVRGLLCSACNQGLGKFRDDPKLLSRAIDYLTKEQR